MLKKQSSNAIKREKEIGRFEIVNIRHTTKFNSQIPGKKNQMSIGIIDVKALRGDIYLTNQEIMLFGPNLSSSSFCYHLGYILFGARLG